MNVKQAIAARVGDVAKGCRRGLEDLEPDIMEMESVDNAVLVGTVSVIGAAIVDMPGCIALALTAELPDTVHGRGEGKL